MKCSNCGRQMSDNARFCEICGAPAADQTLHEKPDPGVDPRYDLSVFSADSGQPPESRRSAPMNASPPGDHAPAENAIPSDNTAPENDDAAKTAPLSENVAQPVQRNRLEENLDMNRRMRNSRAQAGYPDSYRDPRREGNYRGYQPKEREDYRDSSRYDPAESRNADRNTDGFDDQSAKQQQQKVLIFLLCVLILASAVTLGAIFFFNRGTDAPSDLQEAKDNFLPPAQAVTIDTTVEDPSDKTIQFTYDDRARILSCTYKANDTPYELRYTYHDTKRQFNITSTFRNQSIGGKVIRYDQVKTADTFVEVDGYYVRLDKASLTAATEATVPAEVTEAQTQSPSQTALHGVPTSDYPQLEDFLSRYIMWGPREFDARHISDHKSNILQSVANYYSCVNPKNYPGKGVSTIEADAAAQIWPWDTNRTGLAAFDKTEANWICRNIFHITDSEIDSLYRELYNQQAMYTDNVSYYTLRVTKDNATVGKLKSVTTDGKYHYVIYDEITTTDNSSSPRYAVMEFKTIDGQQYWTMYYHSETVPDTITFFDPEGR